MNKLVSKNPVLRFKLGKLIVKMLHGTPGKSSNEKFANWLSSISPKIFSVKPTGGGLLGWINGTSSNLLSILTNTLNNTSSGKVTTVSPDKITNSRDAMKYMYYTQLDNPSVKLKQPVVTEKTVTAKPKPVIKQPINSSMFLVKQGGWNKNIGLGNINDQESKDILDKLGWKDKTAELVQQLLNNNNIGGYAVNVDNKWGNLSKDALKKYYERYLKELLVNPPTDPVAVNLDQAYQAQKPSNQPSAFPKVEMPYTSTGTYNLGQSRILKDLGIRDYSSLVNYVNTNPGSSISSDLILRFGNTSNWNQLNVENEIGIGGHYGRMNRNSLWGYLGGLKNKYNLDYARKLGMMMLGYNKQGGQLVSKNPIKRFKSNFR